MFNGTVFSALVDSGAEVNVIDKDFAQKLQIQVVASKTVAQAANKIPLDVYGQTSEPINVQCMTDKGNKMLYLGVMLVVTNLGCPFLLGEPAKMTNNIICLPRQKLILLANGDDVQYANYDENGIKYTLVRAISNVVLNPGEQLQYKLPDEFQQEEYVAISPRPNFSHWLRPTILHPVDNIVYISNTTTFPVEIKKMSHLADIRSTILVSPVHISPFPQATHSDDFQFQNFAMARDIKPEYVQQIQVDPDKILNDSDRDLFDKLHIRFQSVFTPQPGKYNGSQGYIDNKLQFATMPPPNSRTRVPNYSPAMNDILAQKMDLLESWGVLAKPEQLGVSVEFVSPSLLVPKPEKGEYRVVTDFSALNMYLKKVPNTSATIAQAKARIARARYVIHMDLASYFYQNGMQKNDVKYLGTIHPYKGLRIYTCDPQGLKGASERCYEKLVRIYGDMVQHGQLAQMADGLHVLGDTVLELAKNYTEVLDRAHKCGLTFKPTKVIVCPLNITLFGWEWKGNVWFPTSHTVSALCNAPIPNTVKQMRSFLGSF